MSIDSRHQLLVQQLKDIQGSQLLRGLSQQRRDRMMGDLAEMWGRLTVLGVLWTEFGSVARWLTGAAVRRCLAHVSAALDILETGRPLSLSERDPCR